MNRRPAEPERPFPFTPEEDAQILKGSPDFRSVADKMFVPISAVRTRFNDLTTKKRAPTRPVTSKEVALAVALRETGKTWDAVAFELDRDRASVRRAMKKEGYP